MAAARWQSALGAIAILAVLAFRVAGAQECDLSLYKDPAQTVPYSIALDPPFAQPARVCALVDIDVTDAPFPCYNITLTKVTLCTATLQALLPGDPSNPSATGCNTPITVGSLITNVLYDAANPHAVLSAYNPHFAFIGPAQHNKVTFCYDSHAFSPFNNVLQADWHYVAVGCSSNEACAAPADGGGCHICDASNPSDTDCVPSLQGGNTAAPQDSSSSSSSSAPDPPVSGDSTCYSEHLVECPKGKSLVLGTPPGVGGACATIGRSKEAVVEILLGALVLLLLACVLVAMVVVFWAPRKRKGYYQVTEVVYDDEEEAGAHRGGGKPVTARPRVFDELHISAK